MNQKKFPTKLPREAVQGIHDIIQKIISETTYPTDNEKLLLANFYEIRLKLYTKLGSYQKEYRIAFTAAHAIALRMLYTRFVRNPSSYIGNKLHKLAFDIDKWTA